MVCCENGVTKFCREHMIDATGLSRVCQNSLECKYDKVEFEIPKIATELRNFELFKDHLCLWVNLNGPIYCGVVPQNQEAQEDNLILTLGKQVCKLPLVLHCIIVSLHEVQLSNSYFYINEPFLL